MRERIACEFFLVRYVPDVVKGEFVNIGVVLREAVGPRSAGAAATGTPPSAGRGTQVRFTRDWSRVRCLDAEADVGLLEGLEAEFAARLRMEEAGGPVAAGVKPILAVLNDMLSNSVQITEPRACLAETRALELEQLMRMYVEPVRVKATRVKTGRAAIAAAMRSEFERAGVWGLMRKRISAALYTGAGDPMKIDCGYRPNGVIKMFHAVSLENDVEAAKGLAYSASRLREGVGRVEGAELELTAVVEPLRGVAEDVEGEAAERYRFGVDAMAREAVRVLTVNDLARAAETARIELRV